MMQVRLTAVRAMSLDRWIDVAPDGIDFPEVDRVQVVRARDPLLGMYHIKDYTQYMYLHTYHIHMMKARDVICMYAYLIPQEYAIPGILHCCNTLLPCIYQLPLFYTSYFVVVVSGAD
jgi:hypothetical protein